MMAFTGFSSDQEGTIVYDGEKFIISKPENVPDDFNAHGKPVIGLPPDHPAYPQNQQASAEQTTGQASDSDSGGQGSTGSSQTEARPEAGQATEELSGHAAPPDIDEFGDDFGTEFGWIPSANLDQRSKYTSLDVMRVKQDLEARLLTADRIFATSDSFESGCEHLYAFPEDVGGYDVIRRAWVLCQVPRDGSGGSSGDAQNDVQETFTLEDVRQFIEIDLETAALDEAKADHYEAMLETVFGFKIEWGSNDKNRLNQLQNLARANVHVIDYLDHVLETKQSQDTDLTGLDVFRRHFSQTGTGRLRVLLGADSVLVKIFKLEGEDAEDAKYLGNVPLPASASGEELAKVYLGSEVNIATITHEFMHVLDRNTGITRDILKYWTSTTGVPLDTHIHKYVIKGFAAKQTAHDEIWADIGMTAVLDLAVSDVREPYQVFSVKDTYDPNTGTWPYLEELQVDVVFKCNSIVCEFRDVGWRNTGNASSVREYMIDLFWEALVLRNGEM